MTTEKTTEQLEAAKNVQFCSFYLGDTLCGIAINLVQEINEDCSITQVPLSPDYVEGIMNLRGQIVTIINQGIKLGLDPTKIGPDSRVIIVNSADEQVGVLVDRISDVISTKNSNISKPPANINGIHGKYFTGIYHTKDNDLMAILNIEKVLFDDLEEQNKQ